MVLDYSKIKPLSKASHSKGINGRKAGKNNPSEWVWSVAASMFPRGAQLTIDRFKAALIEAMTYEALSEMIELDQAYMTLNDKNEVVIGIYD
jgi:hypothetical protein